MSVHNHSRLANAKKDPTRSDEVLRAYADHPDCSLTDRQVMEYLGYSDMNAVRPSITNMVKEKTPRVIQTGATTCPHTGLVVRLCTLAVTGVVMQNTVLGRFEVLYDDGTWELFDGVVVISGKVSDATVASALRELHAASQTSVKPIRKRYLYEWHYTNDAATPVKPQKRYFPSPIITLPHPGVTDDQG